MIDYLPAHRPLSPLKVPVRTGLALLALFAARGLVADDEKFPLAPSPVCVAQQQKKGLGEDDAKKLCRERKKRQNRIYYKAREEPVEMTVGSPPMVADDTGTPGPRNWEVNFVISGAIAGENNNFDLQLLDINYGIGDRTQLKFEIPYELSRTVEYDAAGNKTTTIQRGIGNATLGVKYRYYDNEESGLSLAFYPQFEFRTPGARLAEDGGSATPGTAVILPLLLTREFDYVSLTANIGAEKSSEEPQADFFSALGLGTRLTDKLAILGEIAGRGLGHGGEQRLLLNVGLKRKLSERNALALSIGRDLVTGGDGQKHSYFTVAYQRFIEHRK